MFSICFQILPNTVRTELVAVAPSDSQYVIRSILSATYFSPRSFSIGSKVPSCSITSSLAIRPCCKTIIMACIDHRQSASQVMQFISLTHLLSHNVKKLAIRAATVYHANDNFGAFIKLASATGLDHRFNRHFGFFSYSRLHLYKKCHRTVPKNKCARAVRIICVHWPTQLSPPIYLCLLLYANGPKHSEILEPHELRLFQLTPSVALSNKNELVNGCVQWHIARWKCKWVKRGSVCASEYRMDFSVAILYFRLNELIIEHAILGGAILT